MEQPFLINNRFYIEPSANLLKDRLLQTEVQLEPRLMKVLCLLSQHAGIVVSRDHFAGQVWDGYGGASDGLTQAISFLRKIMDDNPRQLIKTVSGKGYMLQATITRDGAIVDPVPAKNLKTSWKIAGIAAFVLIAAVLFFIFQVELTGNNSEAERIKAIKRGEIKLNEEVKPSLKQSVNSPHKKQTSPSAEEVIKIKKGG
jgi:DNA-binding winged helix-turn-helix (wHTH) protein